MQQDIELVKHTVATDFGQENPCIMNGRQNLLSHVYRGDINRSVQRTKEECPSFEEQKYKEREGTKSISGRLNESKNKYIGNNVYRKMGNE